MDKREDFLHDEMMPGEAYRVLLYAAMLGTELFFLSDAEEITSTLSVLRPDLPHAEVIFAVQEFSLGKHVESINLLTDLSERYPDSQLCSATLGAFMKSIGRPGWQVLMESVIEDGRDEAALALVCAALGRTNHHENSSDANVVYSPNAIWG